MSKKIVVAIVVFVVCVGIAIFFTRAKKISQNETSLLASQDFEEKKLYEDSDNDGLKDWEESLWKTDPKKSDSNGDGINDFDSIRAGINPIGSGPNDKLDATTTATKINSSIESDLTETDKFSRELFAKFIKAQGEGDYKSVDYADFLVQTVAQSEKGEIIIKKESDFKKVTNSKENIRSYGNLFGKIIKEKNKQFPGNELEILDNAAIKAEKVEITALDKPISRYRAIRQEMLSMDVPEGLLPIHTKIVNLLEIMITGIENMKFIFKDPVKAMGGTSLYPQATDLFLNVMKDFQTFFVNENIIFQQKEDGYDITRGV